MLAGRRSLVRGRVGEDGEALYLDPAAFRRVIQTDAELSELFMRAFILRRMGADGARAGRRGPHRVGALGGDAAAQGVLHAQRAPFRLRRRREGRHGAGAARSLPRRGRRRAHRDLPRREGAQEPVERGGGRLLRVEPRLRCNAPSRRGGRRRGAGGARGGRVRRLRGARRAGARDHRAGRPGRHELEDRELPGLPHRHLGASARRARLHPGAEVRRRGRDRPERDAA